ncbi:MULTISPECIES: TetR/AcrR family transcriptional regulator [Bacillaceae]|uniref:TetR/AcrR family transcriptional regulator n=1 Tax=Bacillaceae TaxID=186817 RepID=UPI001E43C050|nr:MULTISPECIES: TetR/AcrR family transcriptional regulator [Bacillaceae]MCE4047417.1 TetR/AcrR family transcriptional regulator [Bacillus sp. Au-Bac7]MCM3030696.1 TetR/AcrR family transcriptional regulator [Niallia sp. MER 6]MDL0435890.1 TetR/AcrR family transcriptional regulator [Niallia sp. SS-2023]UPO89566.1 TetR/AcrR family transcriptional regulator [Niallia sp. Man26]
METKLNSRDKILQTASRLFQLQGYHATGMNQIISESGLPKGSIYHHFPQGKESLAIEAVHYTSSYIERKLQTIMDEINDPIEAIQAFIADTSSQFESPEHIEGIPIGLLASETALISEPLRLACVEAFAKWERIIAAKLVQNGYNQDYALKMGMLINSMIGGGIMQSITRKDKAPLLAISEIIPQIFNNKG